MATGWGGDKNCGCMSPAVSVDFCEFTDSGYSISTYVIVIPTTPAPTPATTPNPTPNLTNTSYEHVGTSVFCGEGERSSTDYTFEECRAWCDGDPDCKAFRSNSPKHDCASSCVVYTENDCSPT